MEKLYQKSAISRREIENQETSITPLEGMVALLDRLNDKGGPDVDDYEGLNLVLASLPRYLENQIISKEQLQQLVDKCEFLQTTTTVMGHSKLKPYGYAGDFALIEKIYNQTVCPQFGKWDLYANQHTAAIAVRNRKMYFKSLLTDRVNNKSGELRLLNIASGPARDLNELYQTIEASRLKTTCIELDPRAVDYAKGLCADYLEHITFIRKNIFKFNTEEQYDVVWSAGLFDYFDDVTFVNILAKFIHEWSKPDGEVIVGNFSTENPSRPFMELFGAWHLHHRSPDHLYRLAMEAGAEVGKIFIDKEPQGVNLFLRIQK